MKAAPPATSSVRFNDDERELLARLQRLRGPRTTASDLIREGLQLLAAREGLK